MMGMANREISVNIPGNLDPVYSNRIQIAYKEDEFTFLFLHEIPGMNQARGGKAIVSISPGTRRTWWRCSRRASPTTSRSSARSPPRRPLRSRRATSPSGGTPERDRAGGPPPAGDTFLIAEVQHSKAVAAVA